MLKINPDLTKKIEEVMASQPKLDEDTIVDKIASSNTLRMKKQSIKSGVKQYLKMKVSKNEEDKKQMINLIEGLSKPRKRVKMQKEQLQIQFEDKPIFRFEKMGGISQIVTEIKNNIFLPIQNKQAMVRLGAPPSKGFLLAGPIGSGKTYLAHCILAYLKNKCNFNAYSINSLILASNDAQQNIRKLFQTAKQNQPCIILIDDIDHICNKQMNKRPQVSPLFFFLSEIEKIKQDDIYLIATTSSPQKLDISLKKIHRFQKTITLNMSSEKSRQEIFIKLLEGINHNVSSEKIEQISRSTSGFMAGDLLMLIKQAGLHALIQNCQEPIMTANHILKCIKFVQPMLKKQGFTDIPKTTLDDVGGLKKLKAQLERQIIIPMRQQHKFKEMNFDIQSGGVLLYGPPGCGKTMLAKAIANAVRANFIIVKGPELLNKYVGESEQAVRQVFGRAQRASPCVIFFDQFDALAPKRSDQGNQVTQRVVNTLLTALDGVEQRKMVFVIAATNRKDMIDEATLRAGRIQKHLYVPQPDQQQRVDILKAITKQMKISKDISFIEIGKKTKGFSGADLKYLVKQATVSAVMEGKTEVNQRDLDKSLQNLLAQKSKEKMEQKVHEIELKDNEQNEQFMFHAKMKEDKLETVVQKQENHRRFNKPKVFDEFINYLINRQKVKAHKGEPKQ